MAMIRDEIGRSFQDSDPTQPCETRLRPRAIDHGGAVTPLAGPADRSKGFVIGRQLRTRFAFREDADGREAAEHSETAGLQTDTSGRGSRPLSQQVCMINEKADPSVFEHTKCTPLHREARVSQSAPGRSMDARSAQLCRDMREADPGVPSTLRQRAKQSSGKVRSSSKV
jgi:hypothetical protein